MFINHKGGEGKTVLPGEYLQSMWSLSSQSFSYSLYISVHTSLSLLCAQNFSLRSLVFDGCLLGVHTTPSSNSACLDFVHYLPCQARFLI